MAIEHPFDAKARPPLKIACIGARGLPSNYSGIERACEDLYSVLAERGHLITVYCRQDSLQDGRKSYRGIRLRGAPALRTKSLETLSHIGASLADALLRERFDLIHFHALAPGIFSRLCRLSRTPSIFTVHGLDWQRAKWKGFGSSILRRAERSMVRNAAGILVVSRDLQSYYFNQYGRETSYIPNGVEPADESLWKDSQVLQTYGLAPRRYLLFLGRLVPEKRVEDLIAAYRRIECPYRLVIAGESSYTDKYVAGLRRTAAADPRIIFTGQQARPAVHALLSNAALFVSPSALEGLPMSLLECVQHGTPAAVSDIPSHREILGGIKGYDLFFPAGSVDALQSRIETVLASDQEVRRVADEARRFVLKAHSWRTIAEQTEAMFYSALEKDNRGRHNRENTEQRHYRLENSAGRTTPLSQQTSEQSRVCVESQD